MNIFIQIVVGAAIFVGLSASAIAQPSKTSDTTPTNRFRQFEGTWFVSDNQSTSLGGTRIKISEGVGKDGTQDGVFVFVDSGELVLVDLSPTAASLKQSELKGTYSARDRDAGLKSLLGGSGKFNFSFSPFTDGTSFAGTFFPNADSGASQVSFAATRIGKNPRFSKIVNRVKFKGKRKPGGVVTVNAMFLNRGPGTLVRAAGSFATVSVDGDIETAQIVGTKGLGDSCTQKLDDPQIAFLAECPVEYIGPPKKSTFASITYKLKLADTAGGSTLRLFSVMTGADNDIKTINLKVKGKKKKTTPPPSSGGIYSGTWSCSGFGTITLTQKENDITSGNFSSDSPAQGWFPPNNGTVQNGFVTLDTKTATIKLSQNTGGFSQLDVKLADDEQSFTGNFLLFDSNFKAIGSTRSTCTKQ